MKHYIVSCFVVLMALASIGLQTQAQHLTESEQGYRLGGAPSYQCFYGFGITYNGFVNAKEGAHGYLLCGADTLSASARVSVDNYESSRGAPPASPGWVRRAPSIQADDDTQKRQATVSVEWSDTIWPLPGRMYKVCLPAGMLSASDNPECTNAEYVDSFFVPNFIPFSAATPKEGASLETFQNGSIYFSAETVSPDGACVSLLREGKEIYRMKANVGWDWNLGYFDFALDSPVNLEKAVHYTLVAERGGAHGLYRTDIPTQRVEINLVGAYEYSDTPEPLRAHHTFACRTPEGTIVGQFFFAEEVILSPDPWGLLLKGQKEEEIARVRPTLERSNAYWLVTVAFPDVTVEPMERYCVSLPEGAVMRPGPRPVLNDGQSLEVPEQSGLFPVSLAETVVRTLDGAITVRNAPAGAAVLTYSADGRICVAGCADTGGNAMVNISSPGLYIVVIGDRATKVVVR